MAWPMAASSLRLGYGAALGVAALASSLRLAHGAAYGPRRCLRPTARASSLGSTTALPTAYGAGLEPTARLWRCSWCCGASLEPTARPRRCLRPTARASSLRRCLRHCPRPAASPTADVHGAWFYLHFYFHDLPHSTTVPPQHAVATLSFSRSSHLLVNKGSQCFTPLHITTLTSPHHRHHHQIDITHTRESASPIVASLRDPC